MTTPTYFPPGYFGPVCITDVVVLQTGASAYENITFEELCDKLAERLGDNVWWTHSELCMYIVEALRIWNLLTQYHKQRFMFHTAPGEFLYAFPSLAPTVRGYLVLDSSLVTQIQYHLLEPPLGIGGGGTEQFVPAQIVDSLNRRINRFLVETGVAQTVELLATDPPPVARVHLAANTIDLRRAAWKRVDGVYTTLRRRDVAQRKAFAPSAALNPSTPTSYSQAHLGQLSIELSPPANDAGELHTIVVKSPPVLDGTGGHGAGKVQVPDDMTPIIKWGMLADLLSTANSQDATRAQYCEELWKAGVEVSKMAPSVLACTVNGQPVPITTMQGLDSFSSNWHNTSGRPTALACAGLDLIALSPVPDGVYSVVVDVVSKAIVPELPTDFIQLGPEYIDVLLDYCVHLATFKQGGEEWEGTKAQFTNFLDATQMYNRRLKAMSLNFEALTKQAQREERERPREIAQGGGVRP